MGDRVVLTDADVERAAVLVAARWSGCVPDAVHGLPRGGVTPARLVAETLGVPVTQDPVHAVRSGLSVLVVDDLVDSGSTARALLEATPALSFDALYRKPHSPAQIAPDATLLDGWLVFPWETDDEREGPTDAVVRILSLIGEDPNREGLLDTPKRVVKAFREMTEGYRLEPGDVLGTTFDVGDCDELVVVSGIHFDSLCEHHLLPFSGTAAVGYLPGERVVGLSKVARLVELYARRLQVQERMTTQIATAIMEHLNAQAAGVVLSGTHSCMSCRGVRKRATMTTSAMFGRLRDEHALRAEFLRLIEP